jgi:hypothetical protein
MHAHGWTRIARWAALGLVSLVAACGDPAVTVQVDDPQMAAYVELVMPARIEIQRFLTKPVSFAMDGSADGLEVILAAYDAADDLAKVVGTFHFELQTRRPSETIGTRVAFWPVEIQTEKAMRQYRDALSRYYHFPLQLQQRPLPPGQYVLEVWLHLPAGKRLFDEYEFTYDGKGAPPARGT